MAALFFSLGRLLPLWLCICDECERRRAIGAPLSRGPDHVFKMRDVIEPWHVPEDVMEEARKRADEKEKEK